MTDAMAPWVRLFIAIPIPANVCSAIEETTATPRRRWHGVRWVSPDHMHLSLAFLGEVATPRVPPLIEAMHAVTGAHRAFSTAIRGTGVFGPPSRPRVLWAGFEPSPALQEIQQAVSLAFAPLGFPPDPRPFRPHLTLARFSRPVDATDLQKWLEENRDQAFGPVEVSRVILMRSILGPTGSTYVPQDTAHLAKASG